MREVKFRKWLGYGDWAEVKLDKQGVYTTASKGQFDFAGGNWSQYTGLKDKNGTEIYEGDIVRSTGMEPVVVKWFDDLNWDSGGSSHPGFYFDFDWEEDSELSYHHGFDEIDLEVIGNIYENPELLK